MSTRVQSCTFFEISLKLYFKNMKQCAVVNCYNTAGKTSPNISYHRFPADEETRKIWLLKCGRDPGFDCTPNRVCSDHFSEDDFERDLRGELLNLPLKKRLKPDAIPHLNLIVIKQESPDENSDVGEIIFSVNSLHNARPSDPKSRLDNDHFENGLLPESSTNSNTRPLLNNTPLETRLLIGTTPTSKQRPREVNENVSVSVGTPQNAVTTSNTSFGPISLPASENWVGDCGFSVSFGPQEKTTKGVSWTYSKIKDKLYVGKDAPCPINFATTRTMPDDVCIRTIAIYSSPEHTSEAVHRCINHSMDELNRGIFEAEHLVRCESVMAAYEIDQASKRHSVIVPYENQPAGQDFSTYIYKFTCFGSCAGGPNRRPLRLVFTLERGGEVLGRRRLDVKICACPGRDRRAEEQQMMGPGIQMPIKRANEVETVNLSESFSFTKSVSMPREKKFKPNFHDGKYRIEMDNQECYEFLMQMKKFFEMCKRMNNLPVNVKKALMLHNKPSKPNTDNPDSS